MVAFMNGPIDKPGGMGICNGKVLLVVDSEPFWCFSIINSISDFSAFGMRFKPWPTGRVSFNASGSLSYNNCKPVYYKLKLLTAVSLPLHPPRNKFNYHYILIHFVFNVGVHRIHLESHLTAIQTNTPVCINHTSASLVFRSFIIRMPTTKLNDDLNSRQKVSTIPIAI